MKVKLNFINAGFQVVHRQSQRILLDITGEYCSLFHNFSPIMKFIVDYINKYQAVPTFHSCPYESGESVGVINFNANQLLNQVLSFFINMESGDYLCTFIAVDKAKKLLYSVKVFVTVSQKRSNKRN